jgi:hypothetical protein
MSQGRPPNAKGEGMRRNVRFITGGIILLGILAAGMALASATPDVTSARTITVTAKQVDGELVDVDRNGFDPGDIFIYRSVLYQDGTKVGYENGNCGPHFPVSDKRARFFCTAVSSTFVGRGQITSAGTFTMPAGSAQRLARGISLASATRSGPDIAFAITGGSGQFQNVRGEIHASFTNAHETFHLIP